MMKKAILLFLLIFASNVYAKQIYTDYEFIGYTDEQKEEDEFYRYEEVLFNRFYKNVKINEEYLDLDSEHTQQYVDMDDYKMVGFNSLEKSNEYENIGMIVIKSVIDTKTERIRFANLTHLESFHKIEIYSKDRLVSTIENAEIKGTFIHELGEVLSYDELAIVFYHDFDAPEQFTIDIDNYSGYAKVQKVVVLDPDVKKTIAHVYVSDNFKNFIEKNGFPDEMKVSYYHYEKPLYKYYDLKREYLDYLPEETLDGYEYDSDESIVKYKVYKRDVIEVEDDVTSSDKEPSNPSEGGEESSKDDSDEGKDNSNEGEGNKPDDSQDENKENDSDNGPGGDLNNDKNEENGDSNQESKNDDDSSEQKSESNSQVTDDSKNENRTEGNQNEQIGISQSVNNQQEETSKKEVVVKYVVKNRDSKNDDDENEVKDYSKLEQDESTELNESDEKMSVTNLSEYKSSGYSDTSCDCPPRINLWIIIGLVLILTSIVLIVIHFINVKLSDL